MLRLQMEGLEASLTAMGKITALVEESMESEILETAIDTEARAIRAIQRSPATGRIYQKYNPRRTHRASAPGEAPASDTGRLAGSIAVEMQGERTAFIGTALTYGRYLEFGTSRMASRPWLEPSFKDAVAQLAKRLEARIKAIK